MFVFGVEQTAKREADRREPDAEEWENWTDERFFGVLKMQRSLKAVGCLGQLLSGMHSDLKSPAGRDSDDRTGFNWRSTSTDSTRVQC